MCQLPHPSKIGPSDGDEPDRKLPQVTLLQDQHWSYLQRRYRLTSRELQIAKFACQGLRNENIALKLNISHGTVKTHIRNIYRKMWVNNKISMLLRFVADANNLTPITIGPET